MALSDALRTFLSGVRPLELTPRVGRHPEVSAEYPEFKPLACMQLWTSCPSKVIVSDSSKRNISPSMERLFLSGLLEHSMVLFTQTHLDERRAGITATLVWHNDQFENSDTD